MNDPECSSCPFAATLPADTNAEALVLGVLLLHWPQLDTPRSFSADWFVDAGHRAIAGDLVPRKNRQGEPALELWHRLNDAGSKSLRWYTTVLVARAAQVVRTGRRAKFTAAVERLRALAEARKKVSAALTSVSTTIRRWNEAREKAERFGEWR